jgi:haloacetate dehalogenase
MFKGFRLFDAHLPEARLRVRVGGQGPPLLLLHGHPRTHTTWHRVAPILARRFTVVCPDLRGFGKSSQPTDTPDHRHSSKRAKARDCVALMRQLGFESFFLAGHDRGAYTAFRCAMDHPSRIIRLAVLDAVPMIDAFERTDARFALAWWHWFFFTVPEKPERAINANPINWYSPDRKKMGAQNYADMINAVSDPMTVHGMLEDYRAGPGIDYRHDAEDRAAGRRLGCPTMILWSTTDDLEVLFGDVLAAWRPWAPDLTGHGIKSGHHMAEEAPAELAVALNRFFAG